MKKISIVAGCYNEVGNIDELYERIVAAMKTVPAYEFEIILIDNCSTDGTCDKIRHICALDARVKAIFNVRNFGHIRSPWHGLMQARGDAAIYINSDLEDPPELIPEMLKKWEEGYKLALLTRTSTEEKGVYPTLRKLYYWALNKISNVRQLPGVTGSGLYDKEVIDTFRSLNDPYPYTRGLICELGWPHAEIPFHKPYRKHGVSKGSFLVYFDLAMLAMVNHSKVPLRLATLAGVLISGCSFLTGFYYLILKLLNWNQFQAGIAPALIGIFFLIGLLFLFLGLIGEYIGLIVIHVVRRPLVIEEERLNFNSDGAEPGASTNVDIAE